MQQLIEVVRSDAADGGRAIDQFLAGHVHRDPYGRGSGALAGAGLQHPEFAALNRELTVLHVAVLFFQQLRDRVELLVDFGQFFFEAG